MPPPASGYTAYFVELAYTLGGVASCKFTTEVRVVPDHLPYASDADRDGDIDLEDFAAFQTCFNGPNAPAAAAAETCRLADLDHDADVDLVDFTGFQRCFNGPNRATACP